MRIWDFAKFNFEIDDIKGEFSRVITNINKDFKYTWGYNS
jgi:hypothetical protein